MDELCGDSSRPMPLRDGAEAEAAASAGRASSTASTSGSASGSTAHAGSSPHSSADSGGGGGVSGAFGGGGALLRQVAVPSCMVGRPYRELFSYLLTQHRALPLGLYRWGWVGRVAVATQRHGRVLSSVLAALPCGALRAPALRICRSELKGSNAYDPPIWHTASHATPWLRRPKPENPAWRLSYVSINPAWADVVDERDAVFVLRDPSGDPRDLLAVC